MITGVHAMFYSSQPESFRGFLRDNLGLTGTEVGGGWLIFGMADGEVGVHPADHEAGNPSGKHHISFYCDDIHATIADLKAKYVTFDGDLKELDYGSAIDIVGPGGILIHLYQPKYKMPNKPATAAPVAASSKPSSKPSAKPAAKKPAPKPVAKKKPAPKPAKPAAKKKPAPKAKGKKK